MPITKMLQFLCILIFSLWSQSALAQNSFKIYSNFRYLSSEQTPEQFNYEENKPFDYDRLSFAYRKVNGRIGQEVEWSGLFNKERRDNHKANQFQTQVGYEYSKSMKEKVFNVLTFRLGLATRLYFLREEIESVEYFTPLPVERIVTGIWTGLFAHVEFDVSKRIYINVNTCFISGKVENEYLHINDPNLLEEERKRGGTGFGFSYLEHILRIGIGYRFGEMDKEVE